MFQVILDEGGVMMPAPSALPSARYSLVEGSSHSESTVPLSLGPIVTARRGEANVKREDQFALDNGSPELPPSAQVFQRPGSIHCESYANLTIASLSTRTILAG